MNNNGMVSYDEQGEAKSEDIPVATFDELLNIQTPTRYIEIPLKDGVKRIGLRGATWSEQNQLLTQYELNSRSPLYKGRERELNMNLALHQIAMSVFDPPMDDNQREQFKAIIGQMPAYVVEQMLRVVNELNGFSPSDIEAQLEEAENFFGQDTGQTGSQ